MPKAQGAKNAGGIAGIGGISYSSAFASLSKSQQKKTVAGILEQSSKLPSVDPNVSGWRNFFQKSDGSYVIRDSYFYHNGKSTESLGANVREAIEGAGLKYSKVSSRDNFATWPKLSYLEVVFKVS